MTNSKVIFIKKTDQVTGVVNFEPVNWEYWSEEKIFLKEVARGATDTWNIFSDEGLYQGVRQSWYWVVKGEDGSFYPLPWVLNTPPGEGLEKLRSSKVQLLKELMG